MIKKYKKQEMKDSITMQYVIEALGYDEIFQTGRSKTICCPEHNDTHPSCVVYDTGYHCFACGCHGDIYSYIQIKTGKNFQESLKTVADILGGDWTTENSEDFKPFPLTNKELELLNLAQRSHGYFPVNMDYDGKIITEKYSYSIKKLFLEDKESFKFIVRGKVVEMIDKYKAVIQNYCSRTAPKTKVIYDIFNENGTVEDSIYSEITNVCNSAIEKLKAIDRKIAAI